MFYKDREYVVEVMPKLIETLKEFNADFERSQKEPWTDEVREVLGYMLNQHDKIGKYSAQLVPHLVDRLPDKKEGGTFFTRFI